MRCLYCHNPDTWEMNRGTEMTVDEILEQYDKVKTLIRNGGITATGGEPLMQMNFLTELFKEAKSRGIDTCLDTSGILFDRSNEKTLNKFDELMKYCDLIMLDIKHVDNDGHKNLTGFGNYNVLDFMSYLDGNNKTVWIRHVVVPGITLDDTLLERLGYEIGAYRNIKALDVLPYHDMAKVKYENLGIPYPLPDTRPATKEDAIHARGVILSGMKKKRREQQKV